MTSQHDKMKRWRPKFSIRTLAVVVTLVCLYAACWGPTKRQGVGEVGRRAGREIGFDVAAETAEADYWVSQLFEASPTIPLVIGVTTPGSPRRKFYFWFFGYIAKLPYERAEALPTLLISETGSWDRRAEQSSDVISGGARSE